MNSVLIFCCGFIAAPIVFAIIMIINIFAHPEDYVIGE